MSFHRLASVPLALAALMAVTTPSAFAQPLGTFRWQFAPFCNVVTLYAVKENNTISLTGTDNQCGAQIAALAVGTAFLHPNNAIGVALTVTRPDGIVLTSTIDFDVVTMSGAWRDDAGNSGVFQFSPPAAPPGNLRRITLKGVYSSGFNASAPGVFQASHFSYGKTLPTAPAAPQANIIPFGGPATTNCPGSFANPLALPGQLCLYERSNQNATYRVANSAATLDVADTIGAHIFVVADAAGGVAMAGAWAVTIP